MPLSPSSGQPAGRARLRPPSRHLLLRYTFHALSYLVDVSRRAADGWVLFRAESLHQAGSYPAAMAGFASGTGLEHHVGLQLDAVVGLALAAGVIGSGSVLPGLDRWREKIATMNLRVAVEAGRVAGLALLLVASAMLMAGTYNPFIYFRF